MKLSVSLPEEDVAVLDSYARETGLASRSAALHHAVRLLRERSLEQDYAAAWDEWSGSDDAAAWEGVTADGLDRAAR